MAPMSFRRQTESSRPAFEYDAAREPSLRAFAMACIDYGIEHRTEPTLEGVEPLPSWLEPRACFVTLHMSGELRGCTGTFEPAPSVVVNVAHCAYRTAFHDTRFTPVTREELPRIETEVSLLSPTEPFPVASRDELLKRLSPGVDGLIVRQGGLRATFLPSVWESLPRPADFVDALFEKAGLRPQDWSPDLRFERYTTSKAD